MAGSVNLPEMPIPAADLEMVIEAIRMIVNSGKGYGEIVLIFKKGELDEVRPTSMLKPYREKEGEK
jgi:hypothetical protein